MGLFTENYLLSKLQRTSRKALLFWFEGCNYQARLPVLFICGILLLSLAGCGEKKKPSGMGAGPKQGTETGPASGDELSAREREGKRLFQLHCASCHLVKKRLSGPKLAGVRQRWQGHEDDLIDFIQNSQAYMEGDNARSAYARALYEASNRMVMPAVDLSDEQVRAILAYVDAVEAQERQ